VWYFWLYIDSRSFSSVPILCTVCAFAGKTPGKSRGANAATADELDHKYSSDHFGIPDSVRFANGLQLTLSAPKPEAKIIQQSHPSDRNLDPAADSSKLLASRQSSTVATLERSVTATPQSHEGTRDPSHPPRIPAMRSVISGPVGPTFHQKGIQANRYHHL
jgi:hypothetical protein